MNKIISINLAGRMIAIDESAYEPLRQYINWLRQYFGKEKDGLEIVQDMESRIAEIFENKLRKGSPCILPSDVKDMISIMGSPEQLRSENELEEETQSDKSYQGENKSHSFSTKKRLYRNENRKVVGGICAGIADYFNLDAIIIRIAFIFFTITWGAGLLIYLVLWLVLPAAQPAISNVSKRLFRNKDKKVIGGVCTGLASYFNTDVVLVRLIFAAPLILTIFFNIFNVFWGVEKFFEGGIPTMILLYLVLWISVPAAKTLPEKLEMSGAKVDVQNISQVMRNEAPTPVQQSRTNVLASLIKIFVFIVLAIILMIIISIIIAVIGLIVGYGFSPLKTTFPFYELLITDKDTELIMWTSLMLLLIAPLIFILLLMKRVLSGRKEKQNNYWYKILAALFVVGILGMVFVSKDLMKNFHVNSDVTNHVIAESMTADTLMIETQLIESSNAKNKTNINWDGLPFLIPLDDNNYLYKNVAFEIKPADNDSLIVVVKKSASGKDANTALESTDNIQYEVLRHGNVLELPSYTNLNTDNVFRFQQVDVEVYIPAGKIFSINEKLLKSSTNNFNLFNKRFKLKTGLREKWKANQYYKFENGRAVPA